MNRLFLWLLIWLLAKSAIAAKGPEFIIDSIAPNYNQAVDLCLFHRFSEAELLLKQIARQPAHPNCDAAKFLLMEEMYLWRGLYQQYVSFADSIGQQPVNYAFARWMLNQQPLRMVLATDSTVVPFALKKKGHIVVGVVINGKLRKFMVDTGAQRTLISTKLANELQLPLLPETKLINSLGQALLSSISLLDSLQIGGLHVANLPIFVQSLWGFGVDGALGWDVLKRVDITIDYKAKNLVFRQPVRKTTSVKNLLGGSRPLMVCQGQTGTQLNLFFDSGSNGKVSFSPNGLLRIGAYKPGRALVYQLAFGGKMRLAWENTVKQTNLKFDSQLFFIKNAIVQRANEAISSVLIDGIVGSKQFQKGRLTIDYLNSHFDYHQ